MSERARRGLAAMGVLALASLVVANDSAEGPTCAQTASPGQCLRGKLLASSMVDWYEAEITARGGRVISNRPPGRRSSLQEQTLGKLSQAARPIRRGAGMG